MIDIKTDMGRLHLDNIELGIFCGDVYVALTKEEALRKALAVQAFAANHPNVQLALWCDGSYDYRDNTGGYAVVGMRPRSKKKREKVVARGWPATPGGSNIVVEFLAIAQAIVEAIADVAKFSEEVKGKGKATAKRISVKILSDCQSVVDCVNRGKFTNPVKKVGLEILKQAEVFEETFRGLSQQHHLIVDRLELHWVPGHEDSLPLHQEADVLAGECRRAGKKMLRLDGKEAP